MALWRAVVAPTAPGQLDCSNRVAALLAVLVTFIAPESPMMSRGILMDDDQTVPYGEKRQLMRSP